MPKTYEPIQSQTLGSNQSSITFTSIPQTYTDLVLIIAGTSSAVGGADFELRLNSDSGTNYSRTYVWGTGTSASSGRASNDTKARLDYDAFANTTQAVNITHIFNYSNTTTYKTLITRSNNAGRSTDLVVNLWRSTSAITSIIVNPSAILDANTVLTLYGIKAA